MIRLIITFIIQLASNALGLVVAASILDKMELSASAFLVAVVIFTLVYMLMQPFFTQLAISTASALRGGVALVATLVALIVTEFVTDGLEISGAATWIEATLIVWLVSLLGVLVLPLIFLRNRVEERRGR
jgi:putative membrane protein